MQPLSKIEQPTSLSTLSPDLSVDVIMKVIEQMERGKESANLIRSLLFAQPRLKVEDHIDDQHSQNYALNHHSLVVVDTFVECLSILRKCDSKEGFMKKRKFDRADIDSRNDHFKSEESDGESSKNGTSNKRGCHKRSRIIGQSSIEEVTELTDDGFYWRKYGQKEILNSKHPRHYYRCTHKHDQKCPATKQVQQISENPTKYNIIYNGDHTCNNSLTTPSITYDSPEESSSGFILYFDSNSTTMKHTLNPSLFPTSAFPSAMLTQECISNIEEMPSVSHDSHGVDNQYSSSSDNVSTAHDRATTGVSSTSISDQSDVISLADICSSAASPYEFEEDYSYIMADYTEVLQDWWAY